MTDNDFEFLCIDRIQKIRQIINKYGIDNFYCSYSGGKDSTVMCALVDEAFPGNKIPKVYFNTGIEYVSMLNHVRAEQRKDSRVVIYNAGVNIPKMLKEKGYPFKSKDHAHKVGIFQSVGETDYIKYYINGVRKDGEKSRYACPKILQYQFTKANELNISEHCCDELKKKTSERYAEENHKQIVMTGERMAEGGVRQIKTNCLKFEKDKLKKFKPLNPLPDEFIREYIKRRNIKLCELYYPPYNFKRTGCKGCPFALHLQEELETLYKFFPNEAEQCERIWEPVYSEYRRLGYRLKEYHQYSIDEFL